MAYWIDDGFDTWPETIRAGTAAAGLYLRCGSWIARNLNDGHVPGEVAAMYGSPEWTRKLVDVGLWEAEGSGYRDVRYFTMGNPTAAKVRARKVAKADRQRRWLEGKTRQRRGTRQSQDASQDVPGDLPPTLPPSKEGQGRAARAREAPPTPENPNPHDRDGPTPTFFDDPVQLAQYHAEIRQLAEQHTRDLAEDLDRRRNGAALARAAIKPRPRTPPPRRDGLAELRALTDPLPQPPWPGAADTPEDP